MGSLPCCGNPEQNKPKKSRRKQRISDIECQQIQYAKHQEPEKLQVHHPNNNPVIQENDNNIRDYHMPRRGQMSFSGYSASSEQNNNLPTLQQYQINEQQGQQSKPTIMTISISRPHSFNGEMLRNQTMIQQHPRMDIMRRQQRRSVSL